MVAKLDGTNGLLQQYDYQAPSTGFSYTFAAGVNVLVMNPAGTLAAGTITMPSAPVDGMTITVESTQQITALTVQGNTGQSLVNGTQTLRPNQPYSWVYRLSNATWYPFAGATNSQIVSGVSQNSTSGTSIDFTGIPAWVKRVTVMFANLSTTGTVPITFRLGTSGGIQATGYLGTQGYVGASTAMTNMSTGFELFNDTATITYNGSITFSLLDLSTNLWVASGVIGAVNQAYVRLIGGNVALSGTLTQLRITTTTATPTFDLGTVNILCE